MFVLEFKAWTVQVEPSPRAKALIWNFKIPEGWTLDVDVVCPYIFGLFFFCLWIYSIPVLQCVQKFWLNRLIFRSGLENMAQKNTKIDNA